MAAIVIEPVQGEGGFVVPSREFMQGLRRICDEHGIVLVVDEVQTGFCRTGKTFADRALRHRARPDRRSPSRSRPASRSRACSDGRRSWTPPATAPSAGTYVGNPVAIAAAHAVLDVIDEERLNERAEAIGETIRARMECWRDRFDDVADVRGLGAMLAIERSSATGSRTPTSPPPSPRARRARAPASQGGDLLATASGCSCPLVIEDAELEEALGVWEEALTEALG